jgi:hypothetical protein
MEASNSESHLHTWRDDFFAGGCDGSVRQGGGHQKSPAKVLNAVQTDGKIVPFKKNLPVKNFPQ